MATAEQEHNEDDIIEIVESANSIAKYKGGEEEVVIISRPEDDRKKTAVGKKTKHTEDNDSVGLKRKVTSSNSTSKNKK
eukprot:1472421-Ditylum_brightwellii.AAC.1